MFNFCRALKNVVIPNTVTSIGYRAFAMCTSLTSIFIPASVTSIDDSAFWECNSLTGVYIDNITNWCDIAFDASNSNPLYHAKNLYLNNELVTELVIPDSVKEIKKFAFINCTSIETLDIGKSVTSIGQMAFYKCASLINVGMSGSVKSIEKWAFNNCRSMISVVIPDTVTTIGQEAFVFCSSLTSVSIPASVTSIGWGVFAGCSSLRNITVAKRNSVYQSIDGSLYTKDGKTLIQYALGKADELFTVPALVTNIGDVAFAYCDLLVGIVIPNSVKNIGVYVFGNCDLLTSIYYKGTADEWNKIPIGSDEEDLPKATVYYYSESQPTESGNWWHYVDGVPTAWAS